VTVSVFERFGHRSSLSDLLSGLLVGVSVSGAMS